MKKNFFLIIFISVCSLLYSQIRLSKYPQINISSHIENDTLIYFSVDLPDFEIIQPIKPNDSICFLYIDTFFRDILVVSDDVFMIDSILFNNYLDYAGIFSLADIHLIKKKKRKWFVVCIANEIQLGTNIQPYYIVIECIEENNFLHSVYFQTNIEDNSGQIESSVRVFVRKNNVYLKGKNLKRI